MSRLLDEFLKAPLFTVAQVGTHRRDGHTWGWRGENGWLWFRSQDAAEKFAAGYRRIKEQHSGDPQ